MISQAELVLMSRKRRDPRTANGHRRREIRKRVMARDEFCALCGGWVDKSLKTPHPYSAEVDEIIPVSLGGSPYDITNVQLSHRICNQKKSNKLCLPQLETISREKPSVEHIETSSDW